MKYSQLRKYYMGTRIPRYQGGGSTFADTNTFKPYNVGGSQFDTSFNTNPNTYNPGWNNNNPMTTPAIGGNNIVAGANQQPQQQSSGLSSALGSIPLFGSLYSTATSITSPLIDASNKVNPQTGNYTNKTAGIIGNTVGGLFDPASGLVGTFSDPNATSSEKWIAALSGGAMSGLAGMKRKAAEQKSAYELARLKPDSVGGSYNPYAVPQMAYGGTIGELAELEKGEVFRTPDGEMQLVRGKTHAQGGETYDLPGGTEILGKNISKKYGKMYKELGQKAKQLKDKADKVLEGRLPQISKRGAELNADTAQREFDAFMLEQQRKKMEKESNEEFKKGGIYIKPSHRGRFTAWKKRTGKTTEQALHSKDPHVRQMANFARNAKKWHHPYGGLIGYNSPGRNAIANANIPNYRYNQFALSPDYEDYYAQRDFEERLAENTKYANKWNKLKGGLNYNWDEDFFDKHPEAWDMMGSPQGLPSSRIDSIFMSDLNKNKKFAGGGITAEKAKQMLRDGTAHKHPLTARQKRYFGWIAGGRKAEGDVIEPRTNIFANTDWNNIGTTLGQMAPIAYNIGASFVKEPKFNWQDYTNTRTNEVLSRIKNRRANIYPQLEANNLSRATYNYNLRHNAPTQGQLLSGLQAGSIAEQRANMGAYSYQDTANQQYAAEYAQMLAAMGDKEAQMKLMGYNINKQDLAARRNFRATAAGQLGELSQIKAQERNQRIRDLQRMGLLNDLYTNFTPSMYGWAFSTGDNQMTDWDRRNYVRGRNYGS